jgi:16S rRNA U516 pseudouridylate synthase RsuA-like enzyme
MRRQIGEFGLGELVAGAWRELTPAERRQVLG